MVYFFVAMVTIVTIVTVVYDHKIPRTRNIQEHHVYIYIYISDGLEIFLKSLGIGILRMESQFGSVASNEPKLNAGR